MVLVAVLIRLYVVFPMVLVRSLGLFLTFRREGTSFYSAFFWFFRRVIRVFSTIFLVYRVISVL